MADSYRLVTAREQLAVLPDRLVTVPALPRDLHRWVASLFNKTYESF